MEPFLQYMAGGPCYECGGKTKYADGGESMQSPGSDEQAQKLLQYLTDQMTKGASPSVLKQTLIKSGIPQQSAEQLIKMAAQSFEQTNFQQPQNPFEEEAPQNMRGGGEFLRKMIGGGDLSFKMVGAPDKEELADWKKEAEASKKLGFNNFNNESSVIQMQAENPGMYNMFNDQKLVKVEDHNKVSNIKNNAYNRTMAGLSGLANPSAGISTMGDFGGIGAGLKGILGVASGLGSLSTIGAKFLSSDKSRVYEKPERYYSKIREGGEWNPFKDDRQKFNIGMQVYDTGGVTYTGQTKAKEKTPLSYTDWANQQENDDAPTTQSYQKYLDNFKIEGAPKVTQRGDADSKVLAQNFLSSMQMINESSKFFADQEQAKALEENRRNAGNTMEASAPVNNPNAYGANTINSNLAGLKTGNMGSTFDLGTTMAKYGGMYKEGGSYTVTPEELQMIMALGGDVEFLD